MTHSDIIEAKGTEEISVRLTVPRDQVRVWKNRGIPRSRFADIMDAFPDVTLAMLKDGSAANDAIQTDKAA